MADKTPWLTVMQKWADQNLSELPGKAVNPAISAMWTAIGKDGWPFPIPLVKDASGWRFDTAAGKEEILNRRIGANELNAMQAALA